jgi:anti-anti-sigma factor
MSFKIKIEKLPSGSCRVAFDGRLDAGTYMEAEKHLAPIYLSPPAKLVFDMTNLDFISSMGIRVILKTRKAVEAAGGRVLMTNLQPQIEKVFEITAALPKESIFAGIDEADRYFAHIQQMEIEKQKGK